MPTAASVSAAVGRACRRNRELRFDMAGAVPLSDIDGNYGVDGVTRTLMRLTETLGIRCHGLAHNAGSLKGAADCDLPRARLRRYANELRRQLTSSTRDSSRNPEGIAGPSAECWQSRSR